MPADARRLRGWQLGWRVAALAAGSLLLLRGTLWGSDQDWPLGPMGQYAFSVPPDGAVHSPGLDAVTVDGRSVRVPLTSAGVGLRRAELESQVGAIERDPDRLQDVAVQAARRHPDWPRYRQLRLVDHVTHLAHGRVAGTSDEVLASWTVVDPEHPAPS